MSEPVLLDTHALVWLIGANRALEQQARRLAETALEGDGLFVSAISFWEATSVGGPGQAGDLPSRRHLERKGS